MKKGYIFITSRGTDPMAGKHLKDPTLDGIATFGACQPQVRKQLEPDDFLFVISGSLRARNIRQYIIGGLQVEEKVHAVEAFQRLPAQRLHRLDDGQITGNVICDSSGMPHALDTHGSFQKRLDNYIIGKNPIMMRGTSRLS